jgi:tripartite-type tricarboxylate transporter receptor subunit TctC
MSFHRHATVVALCAVAGAAAAQTFPSKPLRLIVAQAAGGPTDIIARIYAAKLGELLGQQVVVDNRPGAGGSVAGELTARAPADGYTLVVAANGTLAISPNLFEKLTFDVSRDLAPVALIGNSALVLMVHPSLPAKSVKELLALARARPGAINFGSSAPGATSHLAGELLKMLTGVNITHVPYKGAGPALVGVMSGEIEMLISGASSGLPYIKQRQVRALGVTSVRRIAVLPEVPAIAETVPGYEVGSWYAAMTTAGTPPAVIERLHRESLKALAAPEVQARLTAAGVDIEPLTAAELAAKIRTETERWGKVVRAAGIKPQ